MAEITVREFELALKHCYMTRCNCSKCPIHNVQDCFPFIIKTAYEIIISQEAQIEKYKSANISPVRHGRWIEQCEESLYSCSACGTEWVTIEGTPKENDMEFCPHCGAKMDLKEV